ncbi:MAG TPA: hypothetical protein VNH38_00680 [Candidatus Dormibacteraeota bacterium]|nr:hypothetical protein [Candidatus Dormibacteraeota bacterium]
MTTVEAVVPLAVLSPTLQSRKDQLLESVGRSASSTVAPQGMLTDRVARPKVKLVPPEVAVTVPQVLPKLLVMLTVSRQLVPALACGSNPALGVGLDPQPVALSVSATARISPANGSARAARLPLGTATADRSIVSVPPVRSEAEPTIARRPG